VFASQRRGIANFNKGLAAFMLEDFSQAEGLFAKSAVPSKRKQSAYLLAASAAAKVNGNTNTSHYLSLLNKETEKLADISLESTLVQIKLLIDQHTKEAYEIARGLIDDHHLQLGHDARLLALHIDLCLIEKHFKQAVDALTMARKEKTITEKTLATWEKSAYFGHFNTLINQQDNLALQQSWTALPRKLKQREPVLLAYCRVLAEHKISEPLTKLLVPLLSKSPSKAMLKDLRHLPINQADELIAVVQKHLHKNSQSTQWLSYLGHLALMSGQYAMAEKAFGSLIKSTENDPQRHYDRDDLQALATTYSHQGQYQLADATWFKANQLSPDG
jgi:HemY protein